MIFKNRYQKTERIAKNYVKFPKKISAMLDLDIIPESVWDIFLLDTIPLSHFILF